jgi:hypothetical protein
MEKEYSVVEKKITKLLVQLPPKFLQTLAVTESQAEHWFSLNRFYSTLSECWQASHQGKNDPLISLLKSGEIDKTSYDYIWITHDYYQRLWELVQLSFEYVKPELKRLLSYEPKTAYEVFERILHNSSEERFRVCLEPYIELSARKSVEKYKLAAKICSGKKLESSEEKEVQRLLKPALLQQSFICHPVLAVTLLTCFKKEGKRTTILKIRLKAYITATENLNQQLARLNNHMPSYAWKDGKRGEGQKGGNYKFS